MKTEQLIVVEIGEDNLIKCQEWKGKWKTVKTFPDATIGENGITLNKIEGDRKTPLGLFPLGPAFGLNKEKFNYPYLQITENSYWVDDSNSPFYNNWVELGEKLNLGYSYITAAESINWKSAEHLIEYPNSYELGIVIEYNTKNYDITQKNNKGSAIFFHVKDKDYTAGCIATSKENLREIINWLDKSKEPCILIKSNQKEN